MSRYRFYAFVVCFLLLVSACVFSVSEKTVYGEEAVRNVYVGGFPIGIELKPKGVIVVGASPVETELGSVIPHTELEAGDIIEKINGKDVKEPSDIYAILKESNKMIADLSVRRGAAMLKFSVNLIEEDMTGELRLGIQVRESAAGIGTVTYIKEDGAFGCLGHPITLENGSMVPCEQGYAFNCKIIGFNKGARGKAGELKGTFASSYPLGTVYKNCNSGVFGRFDDFQKGELVQVCGRDDVNMGKAQILTTIADKVEKYDIEIIKTVSQNVAADKGMILRVTDKRLLGATGGIIQGMSGSPILQNGKLIGAVTHVFVSDPSKGYGIYADWMYQN